MLKKMVWIYYTSFMMDRFSEPLAARLGKRLQEGENLKRGTVLPSLYTAQVARSIHSVVESEIGTKKVSVTDATDTPTKDTDSGIVRKNVEMRERLKSLKFSEVTLSAEESPEQILAELGELYTANEIPDQVLAHLAEGELSEFTHLMVEGRGGMVNRWHPTEKEMPRYIADNPQFRSVRDQMTLDLQGKSGIPGRYRVFTLRNPQGQITAWLSCRIAPADPAQYDDYTKYLKQELIHKLEFDVQGDRAKWEARFERQFPHVMELDTINVRQGYGAAADLILARTMGQIEREEAPKNARPKMTYFYRFGELEVIDPVNAEFPLGANRSTAAFISRIGCNEMASRKDEDSLAVREVPGFAQPIVFKIKKRYSSGLWNEMVRGSLEHSLAKMGFSEEEAFGSEA